MGVRAKFRCVEIKRSFSGSDVDDVGVIFFPVTGTSEENKRFWKYTPSGRLELTTINPAAAEQFKVGKEYYLDFTPADVQTDGARS